MKRLLIFARDFNAAKHWANERKLTQGRWVYISSYHNIQGNAESQYIKIPGWELRLDVETLEASLKRYNCVEIMKLPDPLP